MPYRCLFPRVQIDRGADSIVGKPLRTAGKMCFLPFSLHIGSCAIQNLSIFNLIEMKQEVPYPTKCWAIALNVQKKHSYVYIWASVSPFVVAPTPAMHMVSSSHAMPGIECHGLC